MADRVIQRNDTAANWQSVNPILATGEIGIVIDGAKGYKIGDGVTPWNDLPYPPNSTNVVQELGNDETAIISQKVVTETFNKINSKISTADEEDLTSDNGLLKLKNRNNNNGMGYVVLRKDKTFVEQLSQTNTIYEIRYNFDLNGEEVTIPKECTLKFEGGSLSNGIIICDNTLINAMDNSINCEIKGSLTNSYISITWFGAVSSSHEEQIDCTEQILNAIQVSSNTGVCILVPCGTFYHQGLILPNGVTIKGKSINGSILRLNSKNVTSNVITILDDNCEISNITILGNGRYHPSLGDTYEEQQGNGICICNGSRFSKDNKNCSNTKIYDIIIGKCGNNGLAIIDKQKWVYNFHNVTIQNCGNIGFLDKSSDNNYVGFNISHCANIGLYSAGGRNRYSTFKVFVCGYNYKGYVDGTKPDDIYWQGVRVRGSHNSFVAFDIQECGGELLYVHDNSRCNYIQATLDRPGFGEIVVDNFSPYVIRGNANYVLLSLMSSSTYNESEPFLRSSNQVIICKEHGTIFEINKEGFVSEPQTFGQSTLTYFYKGDTIITNENSIDYCSFNGQYCKFSSQVDIPINKDIFSLEKALAFRVYDTREDNSVPEHHYFYCVFEPYKTISLEVLLGSADITVGVIFNNRQSYINVPFSDFTDVYWTVLSEELFLIIRNSHGFVRSLTFKYEYENLGTAVYFRVPPKLAISNFHILDGALLSIVDNTKVFGTTYKLKDDIVSETEYVSSGGVRPKTNTVGQYFFDTSLTPPRPIYWTGSAWVDATGNVV